MTQTLSGKVSNEEIDLIAKKTAYDTINAINSPQVQTDINNQTAILDALAKSNNVASKIIGDPQTENLIKEASSELSFFTNLTEFSRNVLASVNEKLAISVFGVDPKTLKVSFLENPIDGQTHTVDLGQLSQGYQNLLGSQSEILSNFGSLSKDQFQAYLMGRARTFLDAKIAKLPIDSALKGLYNSKFGQQLLSFVGLEKYTPLKGEFLSGVIQKIPGASTFLEGLGSKFGIDLTISSLTPTIEAGALSVETGISSVQAATTIAGQGVKLSFNVALGNTVAKGAGLLLGKIGMQAASAKVLAMVGTGIMPVVGTIIGAVLGAIFGKLIEKIDWSKVKKALPWILGAVVGVPVLIFVGPVAGVVVGVGTFGVLSAIGGPRGLTTAGIGISIALLLKRLGKGFFSVAIKPFLVFFLVAPVVIVIILFIINSGAYIVPPTGSTVNSVNPYIDVKKIANPAGPFENTNLPLTITYNVTISAKKGPLTNLSLRDTCQAITRNGNVDCPTNMPSDIPDQISPSVPYSYSYDVNYPAGQYEDSLIINTLTVTADTTDGVKDAIASASIKVGDPPDSCPSDSWPIAGNVGLNSVTQGPSAPACSHENLDNAIDIGVDGEIIIAVHSGIVTVGEDSCVGKYIKITSVCGSTPFSTLYAHLGAVTVRNGQSVTLGQTLGITDNTGTCTSGPHLHFEFQTSSIPIVQKPYLIRNIPSRCCTRMSCNP